MTDDSSDRTPTTGDAAPGTGGVERRTVLRAIGVGAGLAGGSRAGALGSARASTGEDGPSAAARMVAARIAATDRPGLAGTTGEHGPVEGKTECFRPDEREIYGPTDINAQSGNGGLSVAVNDAGTMTVFRWPYPSHYEQLKYFTTGRDADDEIQVAPNAGAFLGVALDRGDGFETRWLRDVAVEEQYYASDCDDTDAAFSDEIVTRYADGASPPLQVTVRDLVAQDVDAFVRRVEVWAPGARAAKLVAYENVNPVVSKHPQYPVQDWCTEENNQDVAVYDAGLDAIVHRKSEVDESTGEPQSVAVAMGFGGPSSGHQVGGDAYEPTAAPAGRAGPARDAYDDAGDLPLTGNDRYAGQTTGAMVADLEFTGSTATESVVFAAGNTPADAATVLGDVRTSDFRADLRPAKEAWFADLLGDAPMPDVEDETLLALCRRALVTLVTDTEATEDRAIVASIATQAPYGEDWIRDGAYFNYALELVGLGGWVTDRNLWYADVQQRADDPRPSHPNTPPGNWVMNYYGDGVAGGPIPYEIDETGYGVWTMWTHYEHTGDESYLEEVYPAIRRAADFLVECRDAETDLHCPTWEDDRFRPQRPTIVGAALVWLGLKSAAEAATELGRGSDAERYRNRQHQVGPAIDRHLYGDVPNGRDGTAGYGTRIGFSMAEVAWPVCFTPYAEATPESADPDADIEIQDEPQVENPLDHPRIQAHLDTSWEGVAPVFDVPEDSEVTTGQYEVKTIIPLAKDQRSDGPGTLADVRDGIDWLATEHATDDTHVMGEAWKVFGGADGEPEVRSIVSQPHAWEQVLTYLAALEAYPPEGLDFQARTCGSVLEALRDQQA